MEISGAEVGPQIHRRSNVVNNEKHPAIADRTRFNIRGVLLFLRFWFLFAKLRISAAETFLLGPKSGGVEGQVPHPICLL